MKYIYIKINKLTNNLKEVDWFTKNDLFIMIKYGNQERRTNVKWNNNEPEWNESFIFEEDNDNNNDSNSNNKEKYIICEIYDHNMWSPSQRLGVDKFDFYLEELKTVKGKYLEITLGDIFFKKEVTLNLLTLKNNKIKDDKKKLDIQYKKINEENIKYRAEMQDIKTLHEQYMKLEIEHVKMKDEYKIINANNIKLSKENSHLLNEKDKLLKTNTLTLKENIVLNKENISLFDKLESIKNILN